MDSSDLPSGRSSLKRAIGQSINQDKLVVDLTLQHKNHTLLVEGPEIMIRLVGTRRVTDGSR
jgi:hypothetical protein